MAGNARHAVVLGASLAGLFTARVLTETFERVTLVDRDTLSNGSAPRRGVPQSWQSHGLHARGREILENFFPGLTEELVDHGAALGAVQADVTWVNDGHSLRRSTSGMACRHPTSATSSPTASLWRPAGCTASRTAGDATTRSCAGSRKASWSSGTR
jgi:2-polyprenyl-6-methoxyphenol hydroxylase-like FAD-dependent oxidoreductase